MRLLQPSRPKESEANTSSTRRYVCIIVLALGAFVATIACDKAYGGAPEAAIVYKSAAVINYDTEIEDTTTSKMLQASAGGNETNAVAQPKTKQASVIAGARSDPSIARRNVTIGMLSNSLKQSRLFQCPTTSCALKPATNLNSMVTIHQQAERKNNTFVPVFTVFQPNTPQQEWAESLLQRRTKDGHPLKLGLFTASEAPPCRQLPQETCDKFDYRIALASTPDVQVPVSFAPSSIPPIETGWYQKPTFCQKPDDCRSAAMAVVASPTRAEHFTNPSRRTANPHQDLSGKTVRAYWAWELSALYPVINFSSRAWLLANLNNQTHVDPSRCFPKERGYCEQSLQKERQQAKSRPTKASRAGAGKPWQGISKILMGSNFKFTLGLENKQVHGYLTEKFYQGFLSRTLLVYCGPSNAKQYAPGNHSYIDCHDFQNAQELAEHLHYLDNNHTAYLEYFEWKKHPLRPEFLDLFRHSPLSYKVDGNNDMSYDWIDSNTWNKEVPKSLKTDHGWPPIVRDRVGEFQEWGSQKWKQHRKSYVQSRLEAGASWVCDLCELAAAQE